ncbi:conserved hypothetical protein [Bacteroidetes oral taxon 274 str. F0058]|nr:conserved hypothetical protein [Bacteroidetes oral taxon 274 str. F0058]
MDKNMHIRAITPNEYPQIQKANYARKMYLKLGFEIVKTNEEDEIMVYKKEKGNE